MKGTSHTKKQKGLRHVCLLVMFALCIAFAPLSPSLERQTAHAQIPGLGITGIPVTDVPQFVKELTLDSLARSLAQQALSQMTTSIVRWINSGFEGSPAFITDLKGYLLGVVDRVAADFIEGEELRNLCSIFEIDIRQVLTFQHYQTFEERIACSLSDTLLNGNEDLSRAMRGWDDWFQVTTRYDGNQYGALLLGNIELGDRIDEEVRNENRVLDWGDGFRSLVKCTGEGLSRRCDIELPGRVIADQLNQALGWGPESLINADEIGDIVNALFAQLVQQTLTGEGGLLGLSRASGGGSSYLDRLDDEAGENIGDIGTSGIGRSSIEDSLKAEEKMIEAYGDIILAIDTVEESIPASCSLELTGSLEDERFDAEDGLLESIVNVAVLESLLDRYDDAETSSEQSEVYDEYLELVLDNSLHTDSDVTALEDLLDDVLVEIEDFKDDIDAEC